MRTKSCFFSPRTFAIWIGLIVFTQIYNGAYTKSVLSTIERRFQLSSTISAVIATGSQIGNLTVMLFVSYFGQRYHRPRLIASGCLLMIFGYLLSSLPQFIGERYQFDDISVNVTTEDGVDLVTCNAQDKNVTALDCKNDTTSGETSNTYILVMFGIMICGIGGSAIQPLGFSYVDDHATEHNSAVYVGIINSIGLIGPMLGYLSGAFFLKMWVDIGWTDTGTITIQPRHPAWVGAWWLGFVVAAVLMICSSLPVWFYPKEMEKEKEDDKDEDVQTQAHQDNDIEFNLKTSHKQNIVVKEMSGFWIALKKIFRNKRFLLVVASWTCEWFKISSASTFIVKYLEVAFGKSAAASSFLVGVANLPLLVLGTILGSFVIKRWKLDQVAIVRLVLAVYIASLVAFVGFIVIGCGSIDMAGLTVPYPTSETGMLEKTPVSECNAACDCDKNVYTPVCGPGQISYVSPCFAGCSDSVEEEGSIANYTSCSCVSNSPEDQVVSIGRCYASKCENLADVVIALKAFTNFIAGIAATPLFVLLMRSLGPEEKSFGIGIAFFICRLAGWIPAPILVGFAIDETCLFWTEADCNGRSYCRLFDNDLYRLCFGGILIAIKFVSTVIMIYLYRVLCRKARKDEQKKREKDVDKLLLSNRKDDEKRDLETVI